MTVMNFDTLFNEQLDTPLTQGAERLRFAPSPLHTDADIDLLVNALSFLWKQCAIAHAVA